MSSLINEVRLYSKPGCVQCNATVRKLNNMNIPFSTVDISEDTEAYNHVVKDLGYEAVPVVEVKYAEGSESESESWYGFRPDRITEISALPINELAAA